ncbi:MAG TPA: ATP-binding protein [Candidatus Binatia bacterium]|nr:ATP-binding protein [Candidatus Binatia bacterium]
MLARVPADRVLDTLRHPLVVLDAEHRIVSANAAFYRTFPLAPEAVEGRPLLELGDGRWNVPALRALLARVAAIDAPVEDFRLDHDFTGLGRRAMLVNARRVTPAPGEPALVLIALEDITDRVQAAEVGTRQMQELERSNAELEQFAYVASHDLQEPLRAIVGYLQLLEQRYRGRLDADADEFIDYAVEAGRRMQALVNDLLAYARLGTQRRPPSPVDADAALRSVLEGLRTMLAETGAVVTHDRLPLVLVDEAQLRTLLQNLIANAVKFRGERAPRVHVSAEPNGPVWTFAVRDNGIGIEPRHQQRIFTMFQRLHTRAEYPGTGIGLAMCKKIVEGHGGRIWVASEPGVGSTFYFTLPGAGGGAAIPDGGDGGKKP